MKFFKVSRITLKKCENDVFLSVITPFTIFWHNTWKVIYQALLFDFLKSNKNIITDNGINFIYYDNGKGSIKEKFSKINGVLNGDYIEYNRNGTFNIKTYKDGVFQALS